MATQKGRNWSSGDIVTAANLSSIERGVSTVAEEYTPTTWANGDTVTAAALNNIEQGIVNADGGGKTWVTLCEEEVTTEEVDGMYSALLSYSQSISADTIRVTFDETTYTCNIVNQDGSSTYYGGVGETGPDFSEYPFALISSGPDHIANMIYTETAGTYSIKIEALQESGSSDFSMANVTFIDQTRLGAIINCICIINNNLVSSIDNTNFDSPVNVILYKGTQTLDAHSYDCNVSGNATTEDSGIIITGDCIITLMDKQK